MHLCAQGYGCLHWHTHLSTARDIMWSTAESMASLPRVQSVWWCSGHPTDLQLRVASFFLEPLSDDRAFVKITFPAGGFSWANRLALGQGLLLGSWQAAAEHRFPYHPHPSLSIMLNWSPAGTLLRPPHLQGCRLPGSMWLSGNISCLWTRRHGRS